MLGFRGGVRVAVVAVVGLLASGCATTDVPGGTGKCAMDANNPHVSKGAPDWIVGKARYGCDIAADSVTAIVELQRYGGGAWVTVDSRTGGTAPVVPKKEYTVQSIWLCKDGKYRTRTRGYGYLKGQRSASSAWDYSQSVSISC